jgi:RNAse (barnase) inhibitor barstar
MITAPDLAAASNAVKHWPHDPAALLAAADAAKLPAFRLTGEKLADKAALIAALAAALALPRHFGRNWDALADCLMDRAWLPPSGCLLVWQGATQFEKTAAEDFAIACDVFSEAAAFWKERGKPFHVFLC